MLKTLNLAMRPLAMMSMGIISLTRVCVVIVVVVVAVVIVIIMENGSS